MKITNTRQKISDLSGAGRVLHGCSFVNVHITRLEAAAIRETLGKLGVKREKEIYERVEETIEKYNLTAEGDTFTQKFACPLFERSIGCLVHSEGKPAPCIQHACYENKEDLPPDELQEEVENGIERLNQWFRQFRVASASFG